MIHRRCRVICDGCLDVATPFCEDMAEVRDYMRKNGWLAIPRRVAAAGGSPGRDLCPACAKP